MTSFQNSYRGQGWNDCAPTVFASANSRRSVSGGRRTYPKTIITAPTMGPPPSVKGTHPDSVTPNNTTSTSYTTSPVDACRPVLPPKADSFTSIYSVATFETVTSVESQVHSTDFEDSVLLRESQDHASQLLERLLSRPSTLSSREFGHYKTRLGKEIPSLHETHISVVAQSLSLVEQGDVASARDILVQHSLVHNGISSWVLPLRKVIECVCVQ